MSAFLQEVRGRFRKLLKRCLIISGRCVPKNLN